jgi:hypothetical protein
VKCKMAALLEVELRPRFGILGLKEVRDAWRVMR